VRRRGPGPIDLGSSPRGRGGQVRPEEPTLERTGRGDGSVPRPLQEFDPDQGRTPGGVLAAGPQDGPDQGGGRHGEIRGLAVIRFEARGASLTEPADQPAHARAGQRERLGDLSGGLALLPESDHGETYRDRDGARHGATSGKDRHGNDLMLLYRCGDAIKPVSRFRDQTSCRVTRTEPVAPAAGEVDPPRAPVHPAPLAPPGPTRRPLARRSPMSPGSVTSAPTDRGP
jgi:hypothetical protein